MRRNTLFWGAILILAGILFLLNNLGILAINVWNLIWPLFLIAVGVSILWPALFRSTAAAEHASLPLEDARRARILLRHGAGRLQVSAGAPAGTLVEGDFGGGVDLNVRREADLMDVTLSVPTQAFPFFWGPGSSLDWTVNLGRDLPLSLDLETGAAQTFLDLSDLQLSNLHLKSGASSTELTLPSHAGFTRALVETGAASVHVRVPDGVALHARARGGLASIQVDSRRFPRVGDYYESPDYATAANRVDLDIQTGVGMVDVN